MYCGSFGDERFFGRVADGSRFSVWVESSPLNGSSPLGAGSDGRLTAAIDEALYGIRDAGSDRRNKNHGHEAACSAVSNARALPGVEAAPAYL